MCTSLRRRRRRSASPPNSSPPSPISKLSWTCFDPSLINNLIRSPLSPIIDSAHPSLPSLAINHQSAFSPTSARLRVTLPPPLRSAGTNVNTTPQLSINGQNERRHGGRSIKAKAGLKSQYHTERENANASSIKNRFVCLRFNSGHFPCCRLSTEHQILTACSPGCYTCRLRRKKCDEGSPCCTACKNLGLRCDYKRPMWWSNNDQRRHQKDNIKMIIKRKKLTEKTTASRQTKSSPPAPTPHQDCRTRPLPRRLFRFN